MQQTSARWIGMTVGLALAAAVSVPVHAQNSARIFGVVTDPDGAVVDGATVTIAFMGGITRSYETTTNAEGEFIQIGLARGPYSVTVTKDGVGILTGTVTLRTGQSFEMDMQLLAPGDVVRESLSEEQRAELERAEATVDAFDRGVAAARSGNLEEAAMLLEEAVAGTPRCGDCHRNLGLVYAQQENYADAERSLRRAIEIASDDAAAYRALADIYNAQRRFDDAAEASAAAAVAGASGAAAGDDATAVFDQGLIFWNSGRIPEARAQFEQTLVLDPEHAEAHYWLGMANLNEGNVSEAAAELQIYVERAPDGRFVTEATGILSSIQP